MTMVFPKDVIAFITAPGLVMYPWVFEKNPEEDDQGKTWYGIMLRWPKKIVEKGGEYYEEHTEFRRQLMKCAKLSWPGGVPEELASPVRDGDKFDKANNKKKKEELFGHFYANFKTQNEPELVDATMPGLPNIRSRNDFYPGCWASVSGTVFPYDNKGNEGIGVRLTNACKIRDDKRIGGKPAAKGQFEKYAMGAPTTNDADELL